MIMLVCVCVCVYIYIYIYMFLFFHFFSSGLRCINMLVGISLTGGIGNQLEKQLTLAKDRRRSLYILLRN